MRICFICKYTGRKASDQPKRTLHQFPNDANIRKQWISFSGLDEKDDISKVRICSGHFSISDYLEPNAKKMGHRLVLRPGAVPSIRKPSVVASTIFGNSSSQCASRKGINIFLSHDYINQLNIGNEHQSGIQEQQTNTEPTSTTQWEDIIFKLEPESSEESLNQSVTCEDRSCHTTKKRKTPDVATPRRPKRVLNLVRRVDNTKRKIIERLRNKNKYLLSKIQSLQELVNHLQGRGLLSDHAGFALTDSLPYDMQDLLNRKLKEKGKYTDNLRSFALTLHFYSPKAYSYVRKHWSKLLPHPSAIRQWYKVVDGSPGFTKEAFDAIALRATKKEIVLNLAIDEMSIRESLDYHIGDQFYGGVDCGTMNEPEENDQVPMARMALVFMAVSLNDDWQVPIGYFLIKNLTGSERAALLVNAFHLLKECNAHVYSITVNGTAANLSMCRNLGANFDYGPNFTPYFINPATKDICYVFLDLCHMITFVRNTLVDIKILKTCNGEVIRWKFIVMLNALQKSEGLVLANKLSNKHIQFDTNRTNGRLALQVLSESVSKALSLLNQMKEPHLRQQFEDCLPTANFCLLFNNIVDVLNCKNEFSEKKYGIPLNIDNYSILEQYVKDFCKYIESLRIDNDINILQSDRKMGFLGLIICLQNIFPLFNIIRRHGVEYLLTYKLSQDYLKTFFSAMGCGEDVDNEPTAFQFRTTYKSLLVKHKSKEVDSENCLFAFPT